MPWIVRGLRPVSGSAAGRLPSAGRQFEAGISDVLQRFSLAIEADLNGVAVVDPAGRIVLVNAELERMFGHSRAELIGRPVETP
jgi:PAS domain-containing protein